MEIYLFMLQTIERHENKNCLFEHFVCVTNGNTLTAGRSSQGLHQNDAWQWQTEVPGLCPSPEHAASLHRGSDREQGKASANVHTDLPSLTQMAVSCAWIQQNCTRVQQWKDFMCTWISATGLKGIMWFWRAALCLRMM